MASAIKDNKCFVNVPVPVFTGSDSVTVPSGASTPRSIVFSDAGITANSVALVSARYDGAFQDGTVHIEHCVGAGLLTVYVSCSASEDVTITVNVMVY